MTLLTRNKQVAAQIEGTKGSLAADLQVADSDATKAVHADFHVITPTWDPNTLKFERDVVTGSLTMLEDFHAGVSWATATFAVELAGHTSNTSSNSVTAPPLGKLLRACGFEEVTVDGIFTLGAWSATPDGVAGDGDVLDESGQAATVVGTTREGMHTKLYTESTGTFTGSGTLTIPNSGGTVAYSAVDTTRDLVAYRPVSDPSSMEGITLLVATGGASGRRIYLKGCMGNVEFQGNHGDRMKLQFTFTGIIDTVEDGAQFTGSAKPVVDHKTPLPLLGINMQFFDVNADAAWKDAVLNSLSINMANEVTLRENSNTRATAGGTPNLDSWDYADVTGRAPTMAVNVDEGQAAEGGYFENYDAGAVMISSFQVGIDGTDDGNIFEFRMGGIQLSELNEGSRDQVTIWDATAKLTGGTHNGIVGQNSELIIISR